LAADRALGAHPYFVPVSHTAEARRVLGPGALLAPEQAVVFDTDPDRARAVARRFMVDYLRLTNYANNLRRLGYGDDDLAGPSDRLVDDIVAWGSLESIAGRVRAHLAAGADHVCVQVLSADLTALPMTQWRELATLLPDL
jgi:probable F420-dependent oxidoreductase